MNNAHEPEHGHITGVQRGRADYLRLSAKVKLIGGGLLAGLSVLSIFVVPELMIITPYTFIGGVGLMISGLNDRFVAKRILLGPHAPIGWSMMGWMIGTTIMILVLCMNSIAGAMTHPNTDNVLNTLGVFLLLGLLWGGWLWNVNRKRLGLPQAPTTQAQVAADANDRKNIFRSYLLTAALPVLAAVILFFFLN